jgi:hypothetical protein
MITKRVIAVLECDGTPMTIDELHSDLTLRWGEVQMASLKRAVHRMLKDGRLREVRRIPTPFLNTDTWGRFTDVVVVGLP